MMLWIFIALIIFTSIVIISLFRTSKLSDEEAYKFYALYLADRYFTDFMEKEKKLIWLQRFLFDEDAPEEVKKLDVMTKIEIDLQIEKILKGFRNKNKEEIKK